MAICAFCALRFRGVGGEEFAFEIAEVALRLLEVGPLPGAGRGECGELLDALFRQVDPRSQRGLFGRGVLELILQPRCCSAVSSSAAFTAASNGTGSILKSTSPFLIGRFGSIGTSVTCPVTRGTIGMT